MNKDKRYIEIFRAALEDYPCSGGAEASIGFFYGALWADKHPNLESRWTSAIECQPKADEEVIVLLVAGVPGYYKISFAHIVDKNKCEDYDGWNIPGVRYWMPCPKIPTENNCQK